MLTLVYGPLSLDHVWSISNQFDIVLTTCGDGEVENIGIDVDLDVEISIKVLTLLQRLFNLRDEDLKVVLDILPLCKSLSEFFEIILESAPYHNANNLYFHAMVLKSFNIWSKPKIHKFLQVPLIEPYKTFTCIVYTLWLLNRDNNVSIALPIDLVDEVYDYLILLKNFKKVMIYTSIKPRNTTIFDKIDEISQQSGKYRTLSKCIVKDKVYSKLRLINDEDIKLMIEILEVIDELGFTTLNALRDIAIQSLGLDKETFRKIYHKLQLVNLVNTRYLSDGRVVITLTPIAYYWLYKFKEKS